MAISIEQLKAFQSRDLESMNDQTNVRSPVAGRVVEWAMVEIVILLTGIRDNLTRGR
jgi:hypothetical protein